MQGAEFPVVRITLQGMEHSIVHAMSQHFVKMDDACQRAVNQAIEQFDYAGEVRTMTRELIKDAIKSALERELRYGPPYEAVKKIAADMVQKAMESVAK